MPSAKACNAALVLAATLAATVPAARVSAQDPIQIPPRHPSQLRYPTTDWSPPAPAAAALEGFGTRSAFLAQDELLPLAEITLAFPSGSADDPPNAAGLAVLTGEAIRRGGSADLAHDVLDRKIESAGARLRIATRSHRTVVHLSAPVWSLDDAVAWTLDLVSRPAFAPAQVERTRRFLLDSLERRNDDPLDVLEREWFWWTFGRDHAAGRAPTAGDLAGLRIPDLRSFHRCHWNLERAVIALSGNWPQPSLERLRGRLATELDERSGSSSPGAAAIGAPCPEPPPANPHPPAREIAVVELARPRGPSSGQASILIGRHLGDAGELAETERWALEVAAEILGGRGAVSRINGRLRTKEGLAYRANTDLDLATVGQEEFRAFLEVRPAMAAQAVRMAFEEVGRLGREPPHERELAVVKATLQGRLQSRFDTAEETAGYLAENVLFGRSPDYWTRYRDGILAVTAEAVRQAAAKHLDPRLLTVLAVTPDAGAMERLPALIQDSGARSVTILPARDPATLEPLRPSEPTEPSEPSEPSEPGP